MLCVIVDMTREKKECSMNISVTKKNYFNLKFNNYGTMKRWSPQKNYGTMGKKNNGAMDKTIILWKHYDAIPRTIALRFTKGKNPDYHKLINFDL